MTTRLRSFRNFILEFELRNLGLRRSGRPAHAWDGVHVLVRDRSQFRLYAVSVNRRDESVVVKKKLPGGRSNGGTYYTLGHAAHYRWQPRVWQQVKVSVRTAGGATFLRAWIGGRVRVAGVDRGIGGAASRFGAVGIRGDNDEFEFRNFVVRKLD